MTTPFPDGLDQLIPPNALPPHTLHSEYAVDGLSPMAVAVPENRRQAADVMRWAADNRVTVFPRGGGTKLGLGNPPETVGLVLDLSRLNRVIDYQPGDMTATVEAGITIEELQRELATARQFVPLESPLPRRATVGGALSTASVGAMAHAYGPPRDWLIGIGVLGADGLTTKAGGRVVKNVTGYDLNKLYTGSLGTLAVIIEATFKVSPLQPQERMLAAPFASMTDAVAAGRELLNHPAGPVSYLAASSGLARHLLSHILQPAQDQRLPGGEWPSLTQALQESMGGLGLCFFSGRAAAVRRRVDETSAALLRSGADDAAPTGADAAAAARQWAADLGWQDDFAPTLSLKLSAPRRVIPALTDACLRIGLLESPSEALADPGFGAVRLFFWGESDDAGVLETIAETRRAAARHGGTAIVETCHPSIKAQLDVWGEEPPAMELMRRLKQQFDPQRLLNPGRFLGRL